MRAPYAVFAFAVLAFLLPAPASAVTPAAPRGGGGGGGGRAAPARAAAPSRSYSAPRSASTRSFSAPSRSAPARSYAPSARSSSPRFSGPTLRNAAPSYRSTAVNRRSPAPSARTTGAYGRGQGVLGGGQRTTTRDPSGGLRRSASAPVRSTGPSARATGTRRTPAAQADSFRSGGMVNRAGTASRGPAGRATGGSTGTRSDTPGFRGSREGTRSLADRAGTRDSSIGTVSGHGGSQTAGHSSTWHSGDGHHGGGDCHYDHHHGWYDDHHWGLTFSFGIGWGPYYGCSYYYPYHSYVYGCDYAFFYPAPVTWCYAPYGFYVDSAPVYVTRYEVVRETVVTDQYAGSDVVDEGAAAPAAPAGAEPEAKVADPAPAAGSPATEKFLREASDHFRKKEYYEAAVQFRLAALSSPDLPGPLFALGQSLVAMEQDAYAARVLRKAVEMSPKMLEETGDISGVWESPAEFDRVMKALETRSAESPVDGDARFLLAAERYFAGDVRSREAFDLLHEARPQDIAVAHFRMAAKTRFKGPEDLPVIEKK